MSRKTADMFSNSVHMGEVVFPAILLYFAGHIISTSAQSNCPPFCKSCDPTTFACSKCTPSHTVHQGTCEPCGANCVECTYGGSCTSCEAKYGPAANASNCSPCGSNCEVCERNLTYCDSCSNGFGTYPVNRTCGACSAYCTVKNTCFNYGGGTCDKCDPGYYWTPEKSCGPCANNCLSCNISLAYKCDICQPSYGLTPNRTCAPCASNCVSCNISIQCNNCQQGYGLATPNRTCAPCSLNCAIGCNMTGANKCDRCDSGYGLTVNGSCKECSPYCAIGCRNTGAYKCDRCDPGYGLTANGTCQACSLHCTIGCNNTGAYRCDQCDTGFGLTALNGSCKECSPNCAIGCKNTGAYKCDRCDQGYGLTGNWTCVVLTTHSSSGTAESSRNPGITSSFVYFLASTTTTWTTPVTGLPDIGIYGGDITCPMLEVGLGLGVPCGFIIIVLLIVITVMCVQNRSLREYKRQSQDSRQSHTILYSTASIATLQPPLTQYQHLKTQNTQREYEGIDRYDTISTTETETTGHCETPLN